MKITILRKDPTCPDISSCPAQLTIDKYPDRRYAILTEETDPEVLAACAHLIGPGERLSYGPPAIFDGS